MKTLIAIGLGGAVGALARHFFAGWLTRLAGGGFPWGIFAANVLGSFLMGMLIAFLAHVDGVPQAVRAFLAVGVLGAFTTFSTFALETVVLIERGQAVQAAGYVGGSVLLAVLGLLAGQHLGRAVFA